MFLKGRPPDGAATEPIQHFRRAIWYAVNQRMHYASIAINAAQMLASLGKGEGAAAMFKNYNDLCDPDRVDAVQSFVEKGREVLRKFNEEGTPFRLVFSPEEIRAAKREEARQNASWYGNKR